MADGEEKTEEGNHGMENDPVKEKIAFRRGIRNA